MEAEKLQRLHDTLSKLAPRGKVGGLGFNSITKQAKTKDPTLPNNVLYSYFVRAGSATGQYHKRTFDEANDDDDGKSSKKSKKDKKDKKNKKEKTVDDNVKVAKKAKSMKKIKTDKSKKSTDIISVESIVEAVVEKKSKKVKEASNSTSDELSSEKKAKKEKKEKKDKKAEDKNKKAAKKAKKLERAKRDSVSMQFGKYGVIKAEDFYNKKPEFLLWAMEVKKQATDNMGQMEMKNLFKEFIEDYNTATMPSKKYYNLAAWDAMMGKKMQKKKRDDDMSEAQKAALACFDDEKARREEIKHLQAKKQEDIVTNEVRRMRADKTKVESMKKQEKLRTQIEMLNKAGLSKEAEKVKSKLGE
mmetsp:Transcript_22802/g.45839  ORF Transcript_22802/g.45839 Transcript_22802/m.45839 type:complete len:359 (+) Transcript_22802:38-1114(+)